MSLEKATVPNTSNQQPLSDQNIVDAQTALGIITDAPQDGKTYGRKDGQWVDLNPDTTAPATPTITNVTL